jgi:hypothetical protein
MGIKKSSVIIASMLAIFTFFAVVYVSSCTKPGKDMTRCLDVTCQNGGYCNHNPDTFINHRTDTCTCPIGFEGVACESPIVNKYFGVWDMNQLITGSDSIADITRPDTMYTVQLAKTPTPTSFFIMNFNNNHYYNDVLCTLDSMNSSHFKIDTISPFQAVYYSYQIMSGYGYITNRIGSAATKKDSIWGQFITRHKNISTNWEVDTLAISMKLQSQ